MLFYARYYDTPGPDSRDVSELQTRVIHHRYAPSSRVIYPGFTFISFHFNILSDGLRFLPYLSPSGYPLDFIFCMRIAIRRFHTLEVRFTDLPFISRSPIYGVKFGFSYSRIWIWIAF
jgi:hypothetical protein